MVKDVDMKHICRYTGVMAVLFWMALLSSCNSTELKTGFADVSIQIGLTGENVDVDEQPWTKADDYVDASLYEGLRTLRIMAVTGDPTSREILSNDKITVPDNPKTCTYVVKNLPKGITVRFYVIANEESLGMEYTNDVILSKLDQNRKVLFVDEAADINDRNFPRTGPQIVKKGLPMTGMSEDCLIDDGIQPVQVQLYRSVLKINLKVQNVTQESIVLNTVKFGPFFGDRFYLFREREMDVPQQEYQGKSYEAENIATIEPNTTSPGLSLYLYPAYSASSDQEFDVSNSPFTLELGTSVRHYNPLVFATNVNAFVRNTQVNITAVISTTGVDLDFKVEDWTTNEIIVPPYE